uniref:Putative secreted protein n=1 Tax=Anopheles marajoara TaxID=58244 RepID=A0A2M4CBY6_9DIPT
MLFARGSLFAHLSPWLARGSPGAAMRTNGPLDASNELLPRAGTREASWPWHKTRLTRWLFRFSRCKISGEGELLHRSWSPTVT